MMHSPSPRPYAARSLLATLLLALTLTLPPVTPPARAADACDAPVQTLASRTVGRGAGQLNDIAAAPDGLWAVGGTRILDIGYQQPLVQRWDGRRWLTAQTPTFTTPGTFQEGSAVLRAVAVLAANNVWAGGFIGRNDFVGEEALLLRWDGATWGRLPNSGALAGFTAINDLVALSPTNVWAVGVRAGGLPGMARWDGVAWSAAALPSLPQGVYLSAASAGAPDELWVVGYVQSGTRSPVILRLAGGVWASLPAPVAEGGLNAVAAGPGGAVWAVGERFGAPLTMRWDGAQFQVMPTPDSLRADGTMLAAVAVEANNSVWAAGAGGSGGKLLHWDGTAWELFARQSEGFQPTGYNALLAATPGDVWAVGFEGAQRGKALVHRYQAQLTLGTPRIVTEGGQQLVALTLNLSGPAATTVRAAVRTEDAGAVAGRDYTALNSVVSIPRCGRTATVQVPLIAAASLPEGAAFRLVVEQVSGAGPAATSQLVPLGGTQNLLSLPLLESPAQRPAGRIAFVSRASGLSTDSDIFTVGADGTGLRRLTSAPGRDYSPRWSPDGRRIVFVSERDGNPNVYVMNADGSGQAPLTADPETEAAPAFSPDGSQIAFTSNRGGELLIYSMGAAGGPAVQLLPSGTGIEPDTLDWSPDGRQLIFGSSNFRRPGLFILGLDGSLRQLTEQLDATPAWSPDGRLIAFFGQRGPLSGLYLIGADGQGLREANVNFDTDGLPSWSPDGQYIAYGLSSDGRLGITGLSDLPPIALLPNTIALSPAWSPRP